GLWEGSLWRQKFRISTHLAYFSTLVGIQRRRRCSLLHIHLHLAAHSRPLHDRDSGCQDVASHDGTSLELDPVFGKDGPTHLPGDDRLLGMEVPFDNRTRRHQDLLPHSHGPSNSPLDSDHTLSLQISHHGHVT